MAPTQAGTKNGAVKTVDPKTLERWLAAGDVMARRAANAGRRRSERVITASR